MCEKIKNRPVISVIVPVYNVELYLDRCIQSILAQTFKDFELILVDDGSPDNSGAICDAWEKKDKRIKVFHKENGGLSDARNFGVKESSAPYVAFIDSDDYISENYLSYLYELLKSNDADVSMCRFISTSANSFNEINKNDEENIIEVLDRREACIRTCIDVQFCVAVCKLYKRDYLLSFPFPKGHMHEDTATVGKLLYCADKIAAGSKILYAYYQNPNSIVHSPSPKRREDQLWAVTENALYFTEKKESEIAKAAWKQVGANIALNASPFCGLDKRVLRKYYKTYCSNAKFGLKRIEVFIAVRLYFLYRFYRFCRTLISNIISLFFSKKKGDLK